jgi:hypothetical protein
MLDICSAIFLKKEVPERKQWPKIPSEGGDVTCINARKNKVPERRSGLRPSKKELPKRRSGAFLHRNTPGYMYVRG